MASVAMQGGSSGGAAIQAEGDGSGPFIEAKPGAETAIEAG
jgi:hypothetical protein